MSTFRYTAARTSGEIFSGSINAASRPQALEKVAAMGVTPLSLANGSMSFWEILNNEKGINRQFKEANRVNFYKNLARFLGAGLSLENSLNLCSKLSLNKKETDITRLLLKRIREGREFSAALRFENSPFPFYEIAQIISAERSGSLQETLERLASALQRALNFKRKLSTALIYPTMLMIGVILTLSLVTLLIIPRLKPFFEGSETTLPLITKIVLAVGTVVTDLWWVLILIFTIFLAAFFWVMKNPHTRAVIDQYLLTNRMSKMFLVKMDFIRLSQGWGMAIQSGLSVDEALAMGIGGIKNRALKKRCWIWLEQLRQGENVSPILLKEKFLPEIFPHLVLAGENSGQLGPMLTEISDILERDYESQMERAVSLFVPFFTLISGAIVAFLIVSILAGMFAINDVVF